MSWNCYTEAFKMLRSAVPSSYLVFCTEPQKRSLARKRFFQIPAAFLQIRAYLIYTSFQVQCDTEGCALILTFGSWKL